MPALLREDPLNADLVGDISGMLTAADIDPHSLVGSNLLLSLVAYITRRTDASYNFGAEFRDGIEACEAKHQMKG